MINDHAHTSGSAFATVEYVLTEVTLNLTKYKVVNSFFNN